ncbi:DUF4242 domain-containing protein [Ramlibacter rhizophilus]|uniref:DUF4242 domain-containing protein n=1 Tax=Ramlibacter rhizophilus TaxID=1781167 RepID=A0A4Z0BFC3_9BURK|nr:DUF4242 domain-containing protein [Ramlibacter rhizophilus]TFY97520.1 DUF4242 domain-containing protein [Ramlibacter rhizophilus]
MQTYLVERSLPGISMDQLSAAQQRAIQTAGEMSAQGTPVRYVRSTFVPDSGQCMCLFEGSSAEDVKRLNEKAAIPFDRVVEAMDLRPAS